MLHYVKKTFYLALILCGQTYAMDSTSPIALEPPPETPTYDDAGVDLMSGMPTISLKDLSIGDGVSSLSHTVSTYGNIMYGFLDDFYIEKNRDSTFPADQWWVAAGGQTHRFKELSNGSYQNLSGDGATLEETSANTFRLTKIDGTVILFKSGIPSSTPEKFIYPNGFEVTKHIALATAPDGTKRKRIQSVTTNTGLQFKYHYATNSLPSSSAQVIDRYTMPTKITAVNNAEQYCSPTANSCSLSSSWPKATYSWPTHSQITNNDNVVSTITNAEGHQTKYVHKQYSTGFTSQSGFNEPRIHKIISSTSTGASTVEYDYRNAIHCASGDQCSIVMRNVVFEARVDDRVWNYTYNFPYTQYFSGSVVSTGPNGNTLLYKGSLYTKRTIRNRLTKYDGTDVYYSESESNRVNRVIFPEGYEASFQFTNAGMLKKRTESASGVSGAITEAGFTTCNASNEKWCKAKPIWIKDARGYRTDFEYANAHGMVTKITQPAPATGKPRPQTRYFYGQHYAWYKKSSNSIQRADSPVWLLDKESTCATGSASGNGCADANDEVITRYEYGSGSSGLANNLWLKGVVIDSYNPHTGQRELRRTCYEYDKYGNRVAETQPSANLASCS